MRFEKIPLSSEDQDIYLEAYIADPIGTFKRKALLVIPGGGYGVVCSDREGEPIAMAFMPYGYNAFVLHYSVKRKRPYPAQLREVAMSIKHIKDNAEDYGIIPDELFAVGFSAGGHLAASAGVFWKRPEVTEGLDMPYGYNKPTGVMPIYPVVSPEGHFGTFKNLLCSDTPDRESLDYVSVDKHVDSDSSPAFMMHTVDDRVVDVRNTLALARAYTDAGVSYELHVYPSAPHGVALGNAVTDIGNKGYNDPMIAEWVKLAAYWADKICEKNKIIKEN